MFLCLLAFKYLLKLRTTYIIHVIKLGFLVTFLHNLRSPNVSPIKKTTIPLICETSRQTQHAKSRTTQPSVCKTRGARSLTQSANSMETPTTKPENHVQIQYAKRLRTASTTTPASCKNRIACQLYSAVSINTTAVFWLVSLKVTQFRARKQLKQHNCM
jgi:hypothetical protein